MRAFVLALVVAQQAVVVGGEAEVNASTTILPVDSSAFVFSPGNWTGDAGRGGSRFRQTWGPGAYLRVAWETSNAKPSAALLFDTSTYTFDFQPPRIAYAIDGVWQSRIPCAERIPIENLSGAGKHELTVVLHWSVQRERWGRPGESGLNVVRITGLQVDADSKAVSRTPASQWALIVGDSITEDTGDLLNPERTEDGAMLDRTFLDGLQFADIAGNTSSPDDLALVKFAGVFGAEPNQAPVDVPVARAWVVITTGDLSKDARTSGSYSAYTMLRPWDTTSLHSSFGAANGLQVDDGDISPALSAPKGFIRGAEVWFDVTAYLEAVRTGAADYGVAIQANGTADGWQIHATGSTTPDARPRLVVYSADLGN